MILDNGFAAPGDEKKLLNSGGAGFFYGVLNKRLIDDGKHFFRHGFRRRKKSCSKSPDWEHGLANFFEHIYLIR